MKTNFIYLIFSSICIFTFSSFAHADNFYGPSSAHYGNQPKPNVSVSPDAPESSAHYGNNNPEYQFGNKNFSFSVKFPDKKGHFARRHERHDREPVWINMMQGYPVPPGAVIGGYEPHQPLPLYVCRGNYNGGMHPGKLVGGGCNFGWGGNEVRLAQYQVLVSRAPLNWVPSSNGYAPPNVVQGGYENGRPLAVCQTKYNGGMHPGKLVGQTCNIGWGGREVLMPVYNVLVR